MRTQRGRRDWSNECAVCLSRWRDRKRPAIPHWAVDWLNGFPLGYVRRERLSAALRDWQVCELPQEYYMMQNASGEDICRILSAFGIESADRIYTKGGLAALKSNVKTF